MLDIIPAGTQDSFVVTGLSARLILAVAFNFTETSNVLLLKGDSIQRCTL